MNWRGRPLASHETISAATTRTCLRVRADLDTAEYPTRVEIPDRDMATLTDTGTPTRHDFDGEWNYTPTRTPTRPNPTKFKLIHRRP